jgi:hypothetical protein
MEEENLIETVDTNSPDEIKKGTYDYIEKISNGESTIGLPKSAKIKLGDYLMNLKSQYSDAASLVSKYEPSHPVYKENVQLMNDVQDRITNLASQVNSYKKNQAEFIQDFDSDAISNGIYVDGNGPDVNKLYTGQLDMDIDENGNLMFGGDGNYKSFGALSKYYLKDFGAADKILKLTNQIYSQAQPLSAQRKSMVIDQVKSIVSTGGRDSIVSLINDDLIPGLSGDQVPKEYYKRENFKQLSEWFYNKLGAGIEASAAAGYQDKINKMQAEGDVRFSMHQRSKLFDKDISVQTAEEKAKIKQQYGGGTTTTAKGGKGGKTTTNLSVAELHRQNLAKEKAKLDAMKNNGNAVSAKTK